VMVSVTLTASPRLVAVAGLIGLFSVPLARFTDSTDDAVAGVAETEESIDEDNEEAALMFAAAALKASTAEGSLVSCSEWGVTLSKRPFALLLRLDGGFEGLLVILTAN